MTRRTHRRTLGSGLIIAAALMAAAPLPLAAGAGATGAARESEQDRLVIVLVVDEFTGLPLSGWDVRIGPRGPYDFWYTGVTGNTGTAQFFLPAGDYRAWVTQGGPIWGVSFTTSEDFTRVVVRVNPYIDN